LGAPQAGLAPGVRAAGRLVWRAPSWRGRSGAGGQARLRAPGAHGGLGRAAPPKRPAMSAARSPQMPLSPMMIVSPGSSRLVMHASMPAVRGGASARAGERAQQQRVEPRRARRPLLTGVAGAAYQQRVLAAGLEHVAQAGLDLAAAPPPSAVRSERGGRCRARRRASALQARLVHYLEERGVHVAQQRQRLGCGSQGAVSPVLSFPQSEAILLQAWSLEAYRAPARAPPAHNSCPTVQPRSYASESLRPLHPHLPARAGWRSLGQAPSGSAAGPAQRSTPGCVDARPILPHANTGQSGTNSLWAVWLTFRTP